MLEFPKLLQVQLVASDSSRVNLMDILISVQFPLQGQYYYGTNLGLTDSRGSAQITRELIELHFRNDQKAFPMDYRIPLEECDSTISVLVRGGLDFNVMKEGVLHNPIVQSDVVKSYTRARNSQVETTSVQLDLSTVSSDSASLLIPIKRYQPSSSAS
jgi:hypothetical protein